MTNHQILIIGTVFVIGLLAYQFWVYWVYGMHFNRRPITEEDIAKERKLMELEKRHFGHYTNYYERQSKEYQQWRKTIKQS